MGGLKESNDQGAEEREKGERRGKKGRMTKIDRLPGAKRILSLKEEKRGKDCQERRKKKKEKLRHQKGGKRREKKKG